MAAPAGPSPPVPPTLPGPLVTTRPPQPCESARPDITKPMSVRKDREERGGEGTCWDEHWVLHGNQLDDKFHTKKKKDREETDHGKECGRG